MKSDVVEIVCTPDTGSKWRLEIGDWCTQKNYACQYVSLSVHTGENYMVSARKGGEKCLCFSRYCSLHH